jgi:hypothetical protein
MAFTAGRWARVAVLLALAVRRRLVAIQSAV